MEKEVIFRRLRKEFGIEEDEAKTLYGDDEAKLLEAYTELKKSRHELNDEDSPDFVDDDYKPSEREQRAIDDTKERVAQEVIDKKREAAGLAKELEEKEPEDFDEPIKQFQKFLDGSDDSDSEDDGAEGSDDDDDEEDFAESDGDEWKGK